MRSPQGANSEGTLVVVLAGIASLLALLEATQQPGGPDGGLEQVVTDALGKLHVELYAAMDAVGSAARREGQPPDYVSRVVAVAAQGMAENLTLRWPDDGDIVADAVDRAMAAYNRQPALESAD